MLTVLDTPTALKWYSEALGAKELWRMGRFAGVDIGGAPFFLGELDKSGWESPEKLVLTSTRVELFCDDPDAVIARALQAGARGSIDDIKDYPRPWGAHRQGKFVDPFGHIWFVGDRSPLNRFP